MAKFRVASASRIVLGNGGLAGDGESEIEQMGKGIRRVVAWRFIGGVRHGRMKGSGALGRIGRLPCRHGADDLLSWRAPSSGAKKGKGHGRLMGESHVIAREKRAERVRAWALAVKDKAGHSAELGHTSKQPAHA